MSFGPLKIRVYGAPCLREKSKPVKEVGAVERMLIAAMFETLDSHQGVGLAAPQVGINEQIFVVHVHDDVFAVINPKILKSAGSHVMEEGCLSLPQVLVNVKRPKTVWVEFTDDQNRRVEAEFDGLTARVFQHEYDHLRGKLIIDYLPPKERQKAIAQLKAETKAGTKTGAKAGTKAGVLALSSL